MTGLTRVASAPDVAAQHQTNRKVTDYKGKLSGLGKYLPMLFFVLALVLLVDRLADLTWQLWSGKDIAVNTTTSAPLQSGSTQRSVSPSVIASWHLFGKADKTSKVVPTNAPETTLRLTLKGVFASADAPSAIIAAANGQEREYSPGDSLPGGAKLREIFADRVILERQGRFETLSLQRRELNNKELIINE